MHRRVGATEHTVRPSRAADLFKFIWWKALPPLTASLADDNAEDDVGHVVLPLQESSLEGSSS